MFRLTCGGSVQLLPDLTVDKLQLLNTVRIIWVEIGNAGRGIYPQGHGVLELTRSRAIYPL